MCKETRVFIREVLLFAILQLTQLFRIAVMDLVVGETLCCKCKCAMLLIGPQKSQGDTYSPN